MGFRRSGWALAETLLAWMLMLGATANVAGMAQAQSAPAIATTTIADTVYHADGTPATGTVLISWPAFSTAAGSSVPAGSTSATIGTNGALSVQLVPNVGSTPMGSYYTVVYHLDDGSVTREYWVVPVSSYTVAVNAIRSTVLPASVAMQTVSKAYVDTAIAAAVTGHPLDSSTPYVLKTGDTMTGPLVLPGDPTAPLQASDKNYVDEQTAGLSAGLGQKVSLAPTGAQTVTQPAGTQLAVNSLNGVQDAGQFVSGGGNNGIANATASANCTGGCKVEVEQGYPAGEAVAPTTWNNQTHVVDNRGGATQESFFNPQPLQTTDGNVGRAISITSTESAPQVLAQTGESEIFSTGLSITSNALAGGSNTYPAQIQGTVPYFKTTYSALSMTGNNYTVGQHILFGGSQNCYGVGDCLMGGEFITASGGFRDDADEGTHPFDRQFTEDTRVFSGTCSQGCATGSTAVTITPTANGGTQGEGRYLVDTAAAKAITAGTIVGPQQPYGRQPGAIFSGTSFPVSVFLETAQVIPTQSNNISPGTVTVPIATSSVPAGFATNTAALPAASGVACVSDVQQSDTRPLNFETAAYTVVDASHLQMTLNRAHALGATVAVGGLCGYGLEQKVDTINGIRQVFPVIGSDSPTSLLYAGGKSSLIGVQGLTSAYVNASLTVASIARTANVVTVTTVANLPVDLNDLTLTVQGVADPSYNGSFVVTTTGPNSFTYADSGPNSTSTGGSVTYVTGAFGLYPMAEVLSVFNPATKAVDGQMTLAANNVPWAAGDPVEEPHYFQEQVSDDSDTIAQYTPRSTVYQSAGINYNGNNGAGLFGWTISNNDPASSYFGNGGTHTPPTSGMDIVGVWNRSLEMQAGEQTVFDVHCNSHGCGRWNSSYDLFDLDSNTGTDRMNYSPPTSTLTYYLDGTAYSFTPQGLTAGTIDAGTVNASTLNGHVTGSVAAAALPLFGASGSAHQQGAVPDPGATSGTTRFLREDGTWSVPAGGAGSGASAALALPSSSTLMAEYPLTDGAGTVAHDASGNGNDGTLGAGALAPAWTSTGLAFSGSENVSLPAALNAAKTMIFAVYINPLDTAADHVGTTPLVVSNTTGTNGFQYTLYAAYPGSSGGFVDSAWGPDIFSAGAVTDTAATISGYHTLAATLGTCGGANPSVDRLYIDGLEVGTYGVQGCSAGLQSSGNLQLGGSQGIWGANSSFAGTMYFAAFYSNQLTPDQIGAASGLVRNAVFARGAATAPAARPLSFGALHLAGDSITYGYPNLTAYGSLLTLTNPPTVGVNNWGITGITLAAIAGSEDNRVGPLCKSSSGPAVYSIFAGTNDFTNIPPSTPQSVFATLTADIQKMKLAGCRVGVLTMISRAGNGGGNGGASYDTDKKAYNALILSGAKAAGADFIVDVAADPHLGADGAYANSTYFQADGTHPTQAGQQEIANLYSNAYNYTFGHNKANPNVVTAATYQMLSGDGAVTLAATSAQAVTMPDCTGPSGAVYYLNNSTGVAKTVTGGPNQPINGLASAIAIAPNSSLALFDVPNPETTSGCHWEY
jgi:lysophospholipase L1-like esterase